MQDVPYSFYILLDLLEIKNKLKIKIIFCSMLEIKNKLKIKIILYLMLADYVICVNTYTVDMYSGYSSQMCRYGIIILSSFRVWYLRSQ